MIHTTGYLGILLASLLNYPVLLALYFWYKSGEVDAIPETIGSFLYVGAVAWVRVIALIMCIRTLDPNYWTGLLVVANGALLVVDMVAVFTRTDLSFTEQIDHYLCVMRDWSRWRSSQLVSACMIAVLVADGIVLLNI